MSSMTGNSDPYLDPGTNVLKNLRGLTDPELLQRFEARRTHRRIAESIDTPVAGKFDVAHLKAIHRYIFQDVYEWAGQFRTVNISKGGHLFGLAAFLEPALQQILEKLAAGNYLVDLNAASFAGRAAYFLGELNAAHPFREGNGRTQREFIREVGLQAGHYVDWRATTREEMTEASRLSHVSGDASLFARLLRASIAAARDTGERVLEDPRRPGGLPHYRNAMVFTPDISNRFRHRKFLHATLSSSSTM
jgi:cell filamentation protein